MNAIEKLALCNAVVYVKDNRMKRFTGFNFKHGPVYNKLWYSLVRDNESMRAMLSQAAQDGRHIGVVFQLRDRETGRVLFTTN